MRNFLTILFLTLCVFLSNAVAQSPTSSILLGDVVAINVAKNIIQLKTKDGEISVVFNEKTEFKRISPENPDIKSAIPSSLSDISAGDRVVAVVVLSDDKKSVKQTTRVILMTKGDISKKQDADREKWTTRGIAGRVTAVNPAANEITVALRGGMGGERTMVVSSSDKTSYRRYAPNSVKYSDATVSNLGEVKVGDQLRAVGERSADNAKLTAEEVVFGSFRTVAGKIETIDAAKREVTIKDVQTNKSVTVAISDGTLLRRFPAERAQQMAQFQAMRASGQMPQGMGGGQGQAGQAGQPPQRPNGMGGGQGMGRGGRDIDSMLEQMPALNLTELKVGEAIAASSSAGATPDRVTAIKFVAGIEPFLTVPQAPAQGGRPQAAPQINIPGLDGFGAP